MDTRSTPQSTVRRFGCRPAGSGLPREPRCGRVGPAPVRFCGWRSADGTSARLLVSTQLRPRRRLFAGVESSRIVALRKPKMRRRSSRPVPSKRYTDGTRRGVRDRIQPTKKPRLSGAFVQSGRQDLNLRPPGPQPEESTLLQSCISLRAGLSCSEFLCISLRLDPELDPERMFASSSDTSAKAASTRATSYAEGA